MSLPAPAPQPEEHDDAVAPPRARPLAVVVPDAAVAPVEEVAPPGTPGAGLTALERAVLDLESQTWRHGGAKDHAIRERLGLTPTAYYQVVNGLLDREAALAYRPLLVTRLLRTRGTRSRATRRPAASPPATPASQEN